MGKNWILLIIPIYAKVSNIKLFATFNIFLRLLKLKKKTAKYSGI
ncbi:Low molecular weight protein tyrosine phosphatase (EC [uncultured Gammaproteobacteria bacterium]|nr:Low molecular weight protein tyrosine phosphatase (EC [uncultured Gammaproteobacteria bacterium]